MNTHRNPILLGQVETIDLLPPEVRTMLQRQGIYLASDSARPGFTVPLVVNADGLWSLQLDSQLDPERFNRTVQIAGPFYAPGEVIAAPDAACTCPSGDGSLRYPCPKHANECLPAVAATVSKMETTTPAAAQEAALIVEALKHSKATACAYPEARKRHEDALAAAESMLAAAAAPGIDVEQFREAVELLAWQNEGHANPDFPRGDAKKHAEALRLLALIDASPKGGSDVVRGVTVERLEDMSVRGRLKLFAEEDGDMCLMIVEGDGTSAGIEFCASGGRSPRTLEAVRALSRAMEQDNAERPINRATSAEVNS